MNGHLILTDGSSADPGPGVIESALHAGKLLWLDLPDTSEETLALLRDAFGIHPLAVEDASEFGQRPKAEDYDDFTALVFHAPRQIGEPTVEVHFFISEQFLVTVHREDCPVLGETRQMIGRRHSAAASRMVVLYHVLNGLADSYFPVLSAFDDRIDEIQDQIFAKPTDEQLSTLVAMKRWLIGLRKVVTPERDMMSTMLAGTVELPGMTREGERYLRDLYDHLIRISDLVDSYRDLVSGSMDAYMSMVSNRLNVVMKQLTIIATVFLPLSFLTGFFGQNFAWLVNRIGSLPAFAGVGIGTEALAVLALLALFRRRGWI